MKRLTETLKMKTSSSFFFKETAPPKIYTPLYTLSLHDALPISRRTAPCRRHRRPARCCPPGRRCAPRSEEHTSELQSHSGSSYAVFCLKKKKRRAPSPCQNPPPSNHPTH